MPVDEERAEAKQIQVLGRDDLSGGEGNDFCLGLRFILNQLDNRQKACSTGFLPLVSVSRFAV